MNVGTIIFIILMLFCTYMAIRRKESYLYIFIFLYPILPEYFSINISNSLPLLTGARCLFLLLIINTLINKISFKELKRQKFSFKYICKSLFDFKCLKDTKFWIVLLIFFIGETINFITHSDVKENFKEYFKVIVENILLMLIILMNIDTKAKKEKAIKTLVFSAGFVFVLSIIEPFIDINLAEFLDTGATDTVLKISYYRLGLRRATFSFGHPIALSVYTIMIFPLTVFCMNKYNKLVYKLIFVLGIWTLLLTLTRGQIVIGILLLIILYFAMKKEFRKRYLVLTILAICSICLIFTEILGVFLNLIYSVINLFGYDYSVPNWGKNDNAFRRFEQFSILSEQTNKSETVTQKASQTLIGNGEKYIKKENIQVTTLSGTSYKMRSIDNQYLSLMVKKGIIGLISNVIVYISLLKIFIASKYKNELSKALFFSMLVAIISYFTTSQITTNRIFWLIACFIVLEEYQNIKNVKKSRKKRIGIFGAELLSNNLGVSALGITQLSSIEKIVQNKKFKAEYYIFSNDDGEQVEKLKKQFNIKSDIKIQKLINFRSGFKGLHFILKKIEECDMIFDLTYGDSFSDIYGMKNYIIYTIPKLMTIHKKKELIIAPQTIGPYKNIISKYISKRVLRKAKLICVRDKESYDLAYKMTKREDIILTSDLAMELPFEKQKLPGNKFKIGLNISDLLWENTKKEFGLVIDYKKIIEEIISKFSNDKYEIHLIAHVFDKNNERGEYELARNINKLFPKTIVAPKFNNPMEVKSYMSGLDLFFGARMHSTIGAFSAGVPVIPMSYSRKFEGLYQSIGYNYGINLREITIEKTINQIENYLVNYDKLEMEREKALKEAIKRNQKYYELLENIIK